MAKTYEDYPNKTGVITALFYCSDTSQVFQQVISAQNNYNDTRGPDEPEVLIAEWERDEEGNIIGGKWLVPVYIRYLPGETTKTVAVFRFHEWQWTAAASRLGQVPVLTELGAAPVELGGGVWDMFANHPVAAQHFRRVFPELVRRRIAAHQETLEVTENGVTSTTVIDVPEEVTEDDRNYPNGRWRWHLWAGDREAMQQYEAWFAEPE